MYRLALFDALAQQPGCRELRLDLSAAVLRLERPHDLGQRGAKAAGRVEGEGFGAGHGRITKVIKKRRMGTPCSRLRISR